MPSFLTHYLLGEQVHNNLNNNIKNIITNNYYAFSLGTNGPDLFYFNNSFPWSNRHSNKRVSNYGDISHKYNINDFFKSFILNSNDDISKSFLCGYLCHWAMDKTCHPYVFYNTDGSNLSLPYHKQFESTIDYLILDYIKHTNIRSIKHYKLLKYDINSINSIHNILNIIFNNVYNIDISYKDIYESCIHIYQAQRLLYDPLGIKKTSLELIEKYILHKPYEYSSMIIPTKEPKDLDILNISKSNWHHPLTNETYNSSFIDLYNTSYDIAYKVLNLYNDYLDNKIDIDNILNYINNENFDNGLSGDYIDNIYNDCIYEKKHK